MEKGKRHKKAQRIKKKGKSSDVIENELMSGQPKVLEGVHLKNVMKLLTNKSRHQ